MAIPATARATGRAFWKADWVIGLTVAVIFAVLALAKLGPLVALEGKAYDAALRWSQRAAADDIAIIAIDDASLANIGRWPWSREVHAKMIDYVASGKPKVIAHLALFSEPERDRG